ncbi:hypothetical protein CONCODRAFT_87766 [Conidiobolus coronatus NRRL 28638]|uniref:Uncharacterized protein n=1 Tax=Conidiobolus coronatus (strain ATCC 28846 / CBS 209.66 / NRRL 28638) TaxID=796925 RepID=A0A137NSA1_CONC2|nr:hypothetical protein CONCODRAFT_87766 [Conidiobolus coronatus NRRL 28638]|eukprot:KXN65631.1 hypothetical protein CONCODRAFT_87766 [Conidiobolus coronatus NRRL 28638]
MQLNQALAVYEITHPKLLKGEWKINSTELEGEHSIDFNFITPTLLQDPSGNPMGKIFSNKMLTLKRRIDLSTQDAIIRTVWSYTLRTFLIEGETDIKGYEKIDWIWKRIGMNSKIELEDAKTGEKIAEFDRKRFSAKYIGDISIFKDLPKDINWLIVFSGCHSVKHIKNEERSV